MSRLSIFAAAAVLSAVMATPAAFAKEPHHVRNAPQYIRPSEARRETLAGTGVAQRNPNFAFAYDLRRFQRTVTPITKESEWHYLGGPEAHYAVVRPGGR